MADQNFRVKKGLEVGVGGTILTTSPNGNIGIGTTNPQTALEINGVLGFGTYPSQFGYSYNNIRIGDNTTGSGGFNNIFIGVNAGAGFNGGGNDNISIGIGAGRSCYYTFRNNFIGSYSGYYNTTGYHNNFFGWFSGYNNTLGASNNFFGKECGFYNTSGTDNTFIGDVSGYNNTLGNDNSFLGSGAGYYNTTGSRNNFFGAFSGLSTSASNKIIIGSGCFYNFFDSPDTTKDTQFAVGVRTDSNPANYWLVGNENFNIGIGTTNPTSKLTVGGNTLITGVTTSVGGFVGNLTGTATTATSAIGGIVSVTQLQVTGVSTFSNGPVFVGTGTSTGTASQPLQVTGGAYVSDNLGIGSTNPQSKLSVVGNGNFTGVVTATSFYGDGSQLSGITFGVSVRKDNVLVGSGASVINFTGAGVSSVTVSSGIATISIPATVRNTSYTVAYEGQTIFPCSYTIGYVDVFFNGSKLSPTEYTANDGANVILNESASANDIVETIGYNGVLKLYASKQILTDVSSNGLTFYTGKADVGIETTAASWTIRRSLFSSAGIVTSVGIARNIAWSNRTSGIYT